ncbi:MAG: ATP-dependent DNA helicase, partial [Verrucomicrobia bacterium]|nr:ATP-dependent DNA helicase [Verrucomicrobiota bacterium]
NAELNDCSSRLLEIQNDIGDFLNQAAQEHVYWVERTFGGRLHRPQISLHAAPINVAEYLRQRLFSCDTSVIMTSATLSIGEEQNGEEEKIERSPRRSYRGGIRRVLPVGLDYIAGRLGAESANTLQVGSPFDYEKQMKLYLVNKMPDPRDEAYQSKLIEYIQHFIKQTHGKAFVLFTNNRLMQDAAAELEPFFEDLGIDLYVQGGGLPRSAMLNEFRKNTDSVLFGLDSFWQGVDVPGESLSNVIITRLPFVVPDHPLTEARLEMIQQRGGDPFMEYSLPEAILKFRQGIGRLIRTQSDHGIVVVLDNRLLNKFYGNAFLNAVPRCAVEVI